MTATSTSFIVHEGQAWFDAYAIQNAASSAKAEADGYWYKLIEEQRIGLDKKIKELVVELNDMHTQWCAAEQRAAKLDRAEEAMREYEQTIGEQAKEIERLRAHVRPANRFPREKA